MRLILSRKGFDSSTGGVPSPIFQDGTMISLPIPSRNQNSWTYSQISKAGKNLGQLVQAFPGSKIAAAHNAHLDPDLEHTSIKRKNGWKPAFGQAGAAQRHLQNNGVKKNDLFLFFGLFQHVSVTGLKIVHQGRPWIHALFGWLLVDQVVSVKSINAAYPSWLASHPHLRKNYANNTIYIAQKNLSSVHPSLAGIPGGGVFDKLRSGLVLSAPIPNQLPSVWQLPAWFMHPNSGLHLTYHSQTILKNGHQRWTLVGNGSCHLRTVGQGQEFVLDPSQYYPLAKAWAVKVLSLAKGNFR